MRDLLLPVALSALLHGAIVIALPNVLDGPRLEQVSSDAIEIVLAAGAPMASAPVEESSIDLPPIEPEASRATATVASPMPVPVSMPSTAPAATSAPKPVAAPMLEAEAPSEAPPAPDRAADDPVALAPAAVPMLPLDLPRLDIAPSSAPSDLARGDRAATAVSGANPAPDYPRIARRRSLEGTALLCILVRADGTCGKVEVARSSGHAVLDRAAVRAAERWRFEPAQRSGRPVDDWIEIPIEFHLTDSGG